MIIKKDWNKIFWDTFFMAYGKALEIAHRSGYDTARLKDQISVHILKQISDSFHFKSLWKIERFKDDFLYHLGKEPDTSLIHGNLALNEGLNTILSIICGGAGTTYANGTAQLGTGTSSAAENAAHTDLQAGGVWKAMDASYPTYGTSQQAIWRSTFGESDANQDWEEYSVRNSSAADKNLNRKISSQGTKGAGNIWILTLTVTGA